MSTVPVDLVHIISSATELDLGDAPGHNERPVIFLQQLREKRDYRTCDIDVLLADGEREHLHSIVGCAHSGNLQRMVSSSDSIPVLLDATEFSAEAVRRVIDWMYFGRVSCSEEELVDLLRVSYFMGVTFFRRQLDLILRRIGKSGSKKLVKMFNIATRTDCGLSRETLKQLLGEMAERPLTQEDLFQLRSRSVLAMVSSAEVKLKTKAHLITLAVCWLNNPRREANVEEVITAVAVPQMDYEDMEALRSSLRSTVTNPLMRRYVRVEERDGRLRLIVEPDDVVTSVNNSTEESDRTSKSKKMKAQVKSWWERSRESRKSTSARSKKHKKKTINLPEVIKKGEQKRIRALPNAFNNRLQRSFTDTELKQIRNLPDFFDENFKLRNSRSFTNTEVEEINALPDLFKKAGKARSFTTTEREEINALPDLFKKAGKARSFTTTEREEINALPDVFVESDEEANEERKKNESKVTKLDNSNVVSSGSVVSTLCPPAPPVSLVTDDEASTARSFSDIDVLSHGKSAGTRVEMEFRHKKEEVKRSNEDDDEPKKTNSNYINLPKGMMSDSFYAI